MNWTIVSQWHFRNQSNSVKYCILFWNFERKQTEGMLLKGKETLRKREIPRKQLLITISLTVFIYTIPYFIVTEITAKILISNWVRCSWFQSMPFPNRTQKTLHSVNIDWRVAAHEFKNCLHFTLIPAR